MKFFNRLIFIPLTLLIGSMILFLAPSSDHLRKPPEKMDCGRILRNDKSYMYRFVGKRRIKFSPNNTLDMSCSSVQNRVLPKFEMRQLKVGVVFARNVYKDYEFLEKQVGVSYHSQNLFCFFIDSKSENEFKSRIRKLGECIENVVVLDEGLPIDSSGHNTNWAHHRCMERMIQFPDWKYFILMQNHDVIGKSVYEISRIFEIFGGANDVDIAKGSIVKRFRWDLKSLRLFRDGSHNSAKELRIVKGSVQGSLSREAVDWIVNQVNPMVFFSRWNQGDYGVDEHWIPTLQANEFLGMPGHFTDKCLVETGNRTDFVTRWTKWSDESECESGFVRHSVCVIGIEEFSNIARMPNIIFNKMMPSFDNSVIECMSELLYNRTFLGQDDYPLEEEYYSNMINVLYHKHHLEPTYKLNCTPSYVNWKNRKK